MLNIFQAGHSELDEKIHVCIGTTGISLWLSAKYQI